MKNTMKSFILGGVLIFLLSSLVLAGDQGMMCPFTGKMMGKMGKSGMCPMHGMMAAKCMHSHSVIPANDGGIIVIGCGTIAKYDKNLNLVKEIERTDMKECMGKMSEMMANCPMCSKAMNNKSMDMNELTAEDAQPADAAPTDAAADSGAKQ